MSANCDVIVIFQFLGNQEQFGSRIPRVQKVNLLLKVTFYLTKTEKRTKKNFHSTHIILLNKGTVPKMLIFCKKFADIKKIKNVLVLKVYFLKSHMCLYLRTKFEVSKHNSNEFQTRLNFTSFPPPQNEPLKSTPRLVLIGREHPQFHSYCPLNVFVV